MTRAEYRMIAAALLEAKPAYLPSANDFIGEARHDSSLAQWRSCVDTIATSLYVANSRFSFPLFYEACGRD